MSELIYLSNARLSFPHIAEPQKQQGPNGERISYNAEFILPPNDPGVAKFFEVVNSMALAKWGQNAAAILNLCQQDRKKRCFGCGEEKVNSKTFQPYDGYPGMVYISAGRNTMPQIIDANGQAVDPANTMAVQALARKMYGGCRVNAAIKPWLQENQHGRAVRCDLVAVQFYADDTPFGEGAMDASGLFGAAPQAAVAPAAGAPSWAMPGVPFGGVSDPQPFGVAPQAPAAPPQQLFGAAPIAPPQPTWAPPAMGVPTGLPSFLS